MRPIQIIFSLALLLPMAIYYLLLNQIPETLARTHLGGWPLSILLGVAVMAWSFLVALAFALFRQSEIRIKEVRKVFCDE